MDKTERYTQLFERYSKTEVSAKRFCEINDIPYSNFLRWARKLSFSVKRRAFGRGTHTNSLAALSPTNRQLHGVYSYINSGLVPCNTCLWQKDCDHYEAGASCRVLQDFQTMKMQEIMDLPHIKPEDAAMVELAVREMAVQALIMRYTSRVGLFRVSDKGVGLQPVMAQYWCSVNALSRILDKLGLSPMARKQLQSGGQVEPQAWEAARRLAGMEV